VTIRPGRSWGELVATPSDLVVADDDAAVHQIINRARRSAAAVPPVAVLSGDLARTVAASRNRADLGQASELLQLTIDVGRAEFDGRSVWFCSHAVIRPPGWRAWSGPLTAVMNAEFLGRWDVAPKSHPNDGRLDMVATEGPFRFRQRLQARRRLPTGTHLPHPALRCSRITTCHVVLRRGARLWLDGLDYGTPAFVAIHVEPDALLLYI
jgi:YegS C-terminal NAD kinase beta sandwich-like domain